MSGRTARPARETRRIRRIAAIAMASSLSFSLGTVATSSAGTANEAPVALSGRRVYQRVCMACHTLSVWGAPKLGDRAAWTPRISKGKEALYFSARNGFNKMPPRGYCDFCTDDELRAAVDYLIGKAQPRERNIE